MPHLTGKNAIISMRGNEVFKMAVNIMGDIVDEILERLSIETIRY